MARRDEGLIRNVLEYFQEATGAEIKYSSSENYEQQIVIDTQAGSRPTRGCRSRA
jgi:alpha-glucoside transport system substrate-binding protein